MHIVAPPANLVAAANGSGGVNLSWNASSDTVLGYYVYRATNAAGPFTRLNATVITGTNYTDSLSAATNYMVRAVKLEVSGSGSYYNASQGLFQTVSIPSGLPVLTITNLGNGSYSVRGDGIPDFTYRIQFADDSSSPNWQMLGMATADSSGVFRFIDISGSPRRFYRSVHP
jgi:hypothetical protein